MLLNDIPGVTTWGTADVLCCIRFNCHSWFSAKFSFCVMYLMHSSYSLHRVAALTAICYPPPCWGFLLYFYLLVVSLVFSSVEGCIEVCKCSVLFIYFFCCRIILLQIIVEEFLISFTTAVTSWNLDTDKLSLPGFGLVLTSPHQ